MLFAVRQLNGRVLGSIFFLEFCISISDALDSLTASASKKKKLRKTAFIGFFYHNEEKAVFFIPWLGTKGTRVSIDIFTCFLPFERNTMTHFLQCFFFFRNINIQFPCMTGRIICSSRAYWLHSVLWHSFLAAACRAVKGTTRLDEADSRAFRGVSLRPV